MTRVLMFSETGQAGEPHFVALVGRNQASGRTAGEALDALTAQLPADVAATLVVVRNLGPDEFFGAEKCRRLNELMERHRSRTPMSAEERAELEQLIDDETEASMRRATALAAELGE